MKTTCYSSYAESILQRLKETILYRQMVMLDTPPLSALWVLATSLVMLAASLSVLYRFAKVHELPEKSRQHMVAVCAWSTEAAQLAIAISGIINVMTSTQLLLKLRSDFASSRAETAGLACVAVARIGSLHAFAFYLMNSIDARSQPNYDLETHRLRQFMLTRAMLSSFWHTLNPPKRVFVCEPAPLPPMPEGWYDSMQTLKPQKGMTDGQTLTSRPKTDIQVHSALREGSNKKKKSVAFAKTHSTPSDTGEPLHNTASDGRASSVVTHGGISAQQSSGDRTYPPTPDSEKGFVRNRVKSFSEPRGAGTRPLELH